MASATVTMAIAVNAGCFSSCRKAKRMSLSIKESLLIHHCSRKARSRLHRVCDGWERMKQNSFDPTQYLCVRADPGCEAKKCKNGKSGSAPEHSEPEAKIRERRLHFRFV